VGDRAHPLIGERGAVEAAEVSRPFGWQGILEGA
jgi:hypothetical protein